MSRCTSRLLSLLSLLSALMLTLALPSRPSPEAKVVRPEGEPLLPQRWRPTTVETVAARPEAIPGRRTTERPGTRRPTWESMLPGEMAHPMPLPLPPIRRRTTKRPPIVVTNGTAGEEFTTGVVDGGWPQDGSTSRATTPPTTTVEAVPLYVIDAPERTQSVASGNCGSGERWHNNRCRPVAGGRR